MTDPAITPRTARCDCGGLSLTVAAPPVHVHACACTQCQRRSGSVMTVTAYFAKDDVRVSGPYRRRSFDAANPDRFRAFCPDCGQTLFFTSGTFQPGTIAVPAGGFADPAFPVPDYLIYWADRPLWLATPPEVQTFEADEPGA